MAGKAVATEGDVTAKTGSQFFEPAKSGTWTAGPVSYVSYAVLTVGGVKVVKQASCGFSFSGLAANGTTPVATPAPQVLTLSPAGPTTLQNGAGNVLRDGDSAQDMWGNKLEVATQNILTSD